MSESENQEVPPQDTESQKDTDSVANADSLDTTSQNESPVPKKNKVEILFKATGNAPIMKRRRWVVENDKTVAEITHFLKNKLLRLGPNESLYFAISRETISPCQERIKSIEEYSETPIIRISDYTDQFKFIYVNQSFAPSPDQLVKNLYECFGTDGKLILHYCKTQAWG